ncbi:MBL fold metallo-hydrolase [Aquipuribacter sp. MA13-6]|uniref:MBL fold metallo-hydrolase n=1 Tax=unclassified Aquipuribacter TaxID=2635084 RepID=UPI003EEB1FE0
MLPASSDRVPALHVGHGDEPVHLDLGAAVLSKASVSEQDNNAYVLTCRATGAQLLVDAADDAGSVLTLLAFAATAADAPAGQVVAVVTSHGHWDHHRALPEVLTATGAPSLVGGPDAGDLPVPADRLLAHGDVVEVGELRLDVVHLRGHTPGSVALVLPGTSGAPAVAVTGDSLFPGGVGNTWEDPARFVSLLDDVEARLFAVLADDTVVAPGHGDGTTLGAERSSLPLWRDRGW